MLEQILATGNQDLSIITLLVNMGIGVILSLMLMFHFRRFGSILNNRETLAQVFPFILLTTTLIITVVKSSLALSLGLVGALSIVRFRTPIKEPEELAYLFLSIAIGLGLGANQVVATVIASPLILTVMTVFKWSRSKKESKHLYLTIDWRGEGAATMEPEDIDRLNQLLAQKSLVSDLRRLDVRVGSFEATYLLDVAGPEMLSELIKEAKSEYPQLGFTFLDQSNLPPV